MHKQSEQAKEELRRRWWQTTGVDEELQPITWDDCRDLGEQRIAHLRRWCESPSGFIVLSGRAGSGKTVASIAMLKEIIAQRESVGSGYVRWLTEDQYCSGVRQEYGNITESTLVKKCYATPLLILDDLGTDFFNDVAIVALSRMFQHRNKRRLATIVTTNLTPDQLIGKFGDRIRSRVEGTGGFVTFPEHDFRVEKRGQR